MACGLLQLQTALKELKLEAESSADSWDEMYEEDEWDGMDDHPNRVEEGLFIGSMAAEHNLTALQAAGVTHVLTVAEGLSPSHPEHLSYCVVHLDDAPGEDIVAHFTKCFEFIQEAHAKGGAVLVHCVAGISRSATVVTGWLMWRHRLGQEEAFQRLQSVRPWVFPNQGFRQQLARFESLGWDLKAWTAWRHEYKEEPLTLSLREFVAQAEQEKKEEEEAAKQAHERAQRAVQQDKD